MSTKICPICGHNETEPSSVKGHLKCGQCGYVDTVSAFVQQAKESPVMKLKTVSEGTGYTLHLDNPMDIMLFRQFGVSNERAEEILLPIATYLQGELSKGVLLQSIGKAIVVGAKHCRTLEELVAMVTLTQNYFKNAGYLKFSDKTN